MTAITPLQSNWLLKNTDLYNLDHLSLGDTDWIPVDVPGGVHPALVAAGLLPDPFYDDNETAAKWVEERTWWYKTTIQLTPATKNERLRLVLQGLDTFATVYLNNEALGDTDNMFREWSFDITKLVTEVAEYTILVRFIAPSMALSGVKELKLPLLGLAQKNTINNLMRKAQYAYGWDWGPRLPNVGLWRPVEVRRETVAGLSDVYAHTTSLAAGHDEATVEITSTIDVFVRDGALNLHLRLVEPGSKEVVYEQTLPVDGDKVTAKVTIQKPKLWWTHDLGKPFLYDLQVELVHGKTVVDEKNERIGIRKLAVNESPDTDEPGATFFQFVLNDVPIFSRGGDWIPLDTFPGTVPDERYVQRFDDAVAGNMNMIRVWGGGIYEQDIFYDQADEKGLLVWHDFMFANTHYPEDEAFTKNVTAEIRYQVTRLRKHTSLAAWCGNNETYLMIDAIKKIVPWTKLIGRKYYDEIIPAVLRELDPDRHYQPSSPYGGTTPNSDKAGDIHDWQTWHGFGKNFLGALIRGPKSNSISYEHYAENMGRFMTEFGIHGQPDIETWRRSISPSQQYPHSPMLDLHNKDFGKQKMDLMMDLVTGRPKSEYDLERYVDYSQITQGEGLRFGLEHFRRRFPHCSGTLIWQYNDCYPVQSWSLTDYYGFLKGSYYYVTRTFAPVVATFKKVDDVVELWLTNNSLEAVDEDITLVHQKFDGDVMWQRDVAVSVGAQTSRCVAQINADDLPKGGRSFLWAESAHATFAANHYFAAAVHELVLSDAAPKLEFTQVDSHTLELTVKTSTYLYALRLHHDSEATRYSDNFVDVRPGATAKITVHNAKKTLSQEDVTVSWNL